MSTNWNSYWTNRKLNWGQAYWTPGHPHRQIFVDMLRTSPPKHILEIGCGAGANLFLLKKAFPSALIAGCDINPEAIETAKKMFKDYDQEEKLGQPKEEGPEVCFKVGSVEAIPFHGDTFDLVLTDACLIYVGPDKIRRALREIRRVAYEKVMFCEFHSESWWKRTALKITSGYNAYDYEKLLGKYFFKYIRLSKIPKEVWPGEPCWETFGTIATALR